MLKILLVAKLSSTFTLAACTTNEHINSIKATSNSEEKVFPFRCHHSPVTSPSLEGLESIQLYIHCFFFGMNTNKEPSFMKCYVISFPLND